MNSGVTHRGATKDPTVDIRTRIDKLETCKQTRLAQVTPYGHGPTCTGSLRQPSRAAEANAAIVTVNLAINLNKNYTVQAGAQECL